MRQTKPNARTLAKEASHERILSAAARAIRRSGFYAHFPSREALLAEATNRACAESAAAAADVIARVPPKQALTAMLHAYLSRDHVEQIELGCPLAALGPKTPRQAPEVHRVTTRHIKEMIDLVGRQSPDWGQPGAHGRALVAVAPMVGTLLLARAVDERGLSDALWQAALKHVAPPA